MMKLNDVSTVEDVMWIELGQRVYRCMAAENDGHRFIQGISALFFLTDKSDDWSDMHWMIADDRTYDFTLERGVAMIVGLFPTKEEGIKFLEAWNN